MISVASNDDSCAYMYNRITGKSWEYLFGYPPRERKERHKQQSQGPNKLRGRDELAGC
jgi:hypothetical protein